MMWYVCLLAALALICLAVETAINRKSGKLRIGISLCLLLAASYLLYAPAFFSTYEFLAALFGGIINLLQIVSLDADYLTIYSEIMEHVGIPFFRGVYLVLLGLVHFLVPAASAVTACTFLMAFFSNLQLFKAGRKNKALYIFSEANEKSLYIAQSIRQLHEKATIIFANCPDRAVISELRQEYGYVTSEKKIEELENLRNGQRELYYYCLSSQQDESMDQALSLLSELVKESPEQQKNSHIFLFSEAVDVEAMLDSVDKGFVNIEVFRQSESAIFDLLNRHPLYEKAENGLISLAVCGFGQVGQAVVRAAVWCGQMDGYVLKIRVAGIGIARAKAEFFERYPALASERYDIQIEDCTDEAAMCHSLLTSSSDATYIVVAEGSDSISTALGLHLRRLYGRMNGAAGRWPLIAIYAKGQDTHKMIKNLQTPEASAQKRRSYALIPFGGTEEVLNGQRLVTSALEGLAKNVHLVYESIFAESEINVEQALVNYNIFEVNKRSNRANAMHIRYKLRMLGLDYTTDPDAEEVRLEDYLTPERLEALTRAEHDRWMAFLESEGWITASLDEVTAYQASGVSAGRHNCPLLKMHPYICPFEELSARSAALGLGDSTTYDRELIHRIPDILHDRWGVSGVYYKIIKTTGGNGHDNEKQ